MAWPPGMRQAAFLFLPRVLAETVVAGVLTTLTVPERVLGAVILGQHAVSEAR